MDTNSITSWLSQYGIGESSGGILIRILASVATLLTAFLAFYIARRIIKALSTRIIARTKTRLDDKLIKNKVFLNLSLLIPGFIVHFAVPLIFAGYSQGEVIARGAVNLYFIMVAVMIISSLLNALHDGYQTFRVSREIPITGLFQIFKFLLYFVAMILMLAIILGKSPLFLISGLGAMTAVLMLIFRDPILGLASGFQLISSKMLKKGDWVEMPKFGADGDVVDITLTTVKIKNWDNTITSVPTYALITDSFKNWRGMLESGGRRIMRAILIDMNSIKFCTDEMLERFGKIRYISDYIEQKNQEIAAHNAELGIEDSDMVNRRRLTNLGTFRAYVSAYLRKHPLINQEMDFLVRQLAPTENGLPLQLYVFCKDKTWANYEAVQADIIDHLLAILPEFDLRVFQRLSSVDSAALIRQDQLQ
jgi:miniconductance mechanosensitive channel